MANHHPVGSGPGRRDSDSSIDHDLPGSPEYPSPKTVHSILGLSSPLASTSTPDSSFLTGPSSSTQKGVGNRCPTRWSTSSVYSRLFEDDWKRQTEAQRRGLHETPSKPPTHGEQSTSPAPDLSDDKALQHPQRAQQQPIFHQGGRNTASSSTSAALFQEHPRFHGQQPFSANQPFLQGRPALSESANRWQLQVPSLADQRNYEIKLAQTYLSSGTMSNNAVDAGFLSSFEGLRVNDKASHGGLPSATSDDGSMAYLSPLKGPGATLSHASPIAARPWASNSNNTCRNALATANTTNLWDWNGLFESDMIRRSLLLADTSSSTPFASTQPPRGTDHNTSSSMVGTWAPPNPDGSFGLSSSARLVPDFPFPRPLPMVPAASDAVFHPMESRPLPKQVTGTAAMDLMVKGFSPNYRGNPDLERNRSAPIPPDQNCSLFITGLAPGLTTAQLLATIRDVGRVYATHINGPEPGRGHYTCAAKVVFFERRAAERFYARYAATGFRVDGALHVGRVVWNRIRSAEQDAGGRKSRVLLISGPPGIVNKDALMAYFQSKIQFQVDEVRTLRKYVDDGVNGGGERSLVEFRFGSYRCQSEAARMALSREFKEYGVFCDFGQDPCDLASHLELPGTENIDNDPAFAPYCTEDQDKQSSDQPCETMGYNWACSGRGQC